MKDDYIYLKHIFEAIEKIEGYLKGVDYDFFTTDEMRFSATVRQLEIIGEASTKVSKAFKEKSPQIDWSEMIGMRNILIHQYSGINNKTVWGTCQEDLAPLKEKISQLLNG